MKLVLALSLALLVLLAGATELLGPPAAERVIEERVADRLDVGSVDAQLKGFPVVPRVLVTGRVPRLDIVLRDLVRPELTVDTVRLHLFGIQLERGSVLGGDARLESIDRGEVEAVVTEEDLQAALPAALGDLELSPGQATVEIAGVAVDLGVSVAGGEVRLDVGPLPGFTLPLPTDILPCPLDGEILEGRVELSCTLDEIPAWVVDEVNRTS